MSKKDLPCISLDIQYSTSNNWPSLVMYVSIMDLMSSERGLSDISLVTKDVAMAAIINCPIPSLVTVVSTLAWGVLVVTTGAVIHIKLGVAIRPGSRIGIDTGAIVCTIHKVSIGIPRAAVSVTFQCTF